MSIIRTRKNENPYVMIDKSPIEDPNISWKAKGILVYLLSKPNDWKVMVSDLVKRSKDGRDAVYSGIKELLEAGYMSREAIRKDGKIDRWEYVVYEKPYIPTFGKSANSSTYGQSVSRKTVSRKTVSRKTDTTNNKITNNEINNNEINNLSIGNEQIDQWLESLKHRDIDGLMDKLQSMFSIYKEMEQVTGFDNDVFIVVCNRVLDHKVKRNFKGLLRKSILSEIEDRKRNESDNKKRAERVPEYIREQVARDRAEEKDMERKQLEKEWTEEEQAELEELIQRMKESSNNV